MPHQLKFSQVVDYESGESGVTVAASIRLDKEPIEFSKLN